MFFEKSEYANRFSVAKNPTEIGIWTLPIGVYNFGTKHLKK